MEPSDTQPSFPEPSAERLKRATATRDGFAPTNETVKERKPDTIPTWEYNHFTPELTKSDQAAG